MKYRLAMIFLCLSTFLGAIEGTDEAASLNDRVESNHDFGFALHYLSGGKSKFKRASLSGESIAYSKGMLSTTYQMTMKPDLDLFAKMAYTQTKLNWDANPYFTKEDYSYFALTLGTVYTKLDNWWWQFALQGRVDPKHWNMSHYAQYDGVLHGRYTYNDNWGIHIGLWGQTGLKKSEMWPVLGVDYKINESWSCRVILPNEASLEYTWNDQWSAQLSARVFRSRHRLSKEAPLAKGIFEYRALGAELGLRYHSESSMTARVFLGSSGEGDLKMMNAAGSTLDIMKHKGAAYIGIELSLEF